MDFAALQTTAFRRAARAALASLWLAWAPAFAEGPAAAPEAATAPAPADGPPVPATAPAGDAAAGADQEYHCDKPGSDGKAMVDKVQRGVYLSVCGTARWFDGLFGTRRYDQDSDATFGRLQVGGSWDDRDGLDNRVRLRVRLGLPTAKRRLNLLIGRVDDQELEADAKQDVATRPPASASATGVDDDSFLVGVGYSKQGDLKSGFDFGAGVRLRTPVEPYTKGTYRHDFVFGDDILMRARQTVFWRDNRGWGETTEFSVDKLLTDRLLLRWANGGTLAEDVERLEWYSTLTTFQSLSNRSGLAYSTFVSGVMNTDVPIGNFGAEVRFRRRVLRKWLFVEAATSVTWPKETIDESREINPGVRVGFEMYFGPVPDNKMR